MRTQTFTNRTKSPKGRPMSYVAHSRSAGVQAFVGKWVAVELANQVAYQGKLVCADELGITLDEEGNGKSQSYIFVPLAQIALISYQQ